MEEERASPVSKSGAVASMNSALAEQERLILHKVRPDILLGARLIIRIAR